MLVVAGLGMFAVTNVMADADISTTKPGKGGLEAAAHVDLEVFVPEILIFGVGATGDKIAKLRWTHAVTGAGELGSNGNTYSGAAGAFGKEDFYGLPTAEEPVNGGDGAGFDKNTAVLPVFLYSNYGKDIVIQATTFGGIEAGAGQKDVLVNESNKDVIQVTDFAVEVKGDIKHPATLAGGATATTAANKAGIINLDGLWSYTYTPTSTPRAGIYQARIQYVAAQP